MKKSEKRRTLIQLQIKILSGNIFRLQRTFYSHFVVLAVTIEDWDILALLKGKTELCEGEVESDGEEEMYNTVIVYSSLITQ